MTALSRLFRCLTATAILLGVPASALAEPAAAAIAPPSADDRAKTSFQDFADTWMEKVMATAEKHRQNPTIRPGTEQPMVTWRGYGEEYNVELQPTGNANSPYVGVLRYVEKIYSCTDSAAEDCTVASAIPVTEIFRFQNGRWVY